jgi:hypothetical protein
MHPAGRNDADQFTAASQGKGYVQQSPRIGMPQGVKSRLSLTVSGIFQHEQRFVEENLLCFSLIHVVLIRALAAIAFVPVEPGRVFQRIHLLYIPHIYNKNQREVLTARVALPLRSF